MKSIPFLLLLAAPALGQTPLEDTGFDDTTPVTDQDVVIVRERAFGAGGIDLSAYGILGTPDFVQSIYVRAYHASGADRHVTRGRLVFPAGITILGVITDASGLGGSTDDGMLTASDLDFGIGGDPDFYSGPFRGLDAVSSSEHVFVRSNNTVDFYLHQSLNDLDDFRVLIDHGSSFPANVDFDVQLIVDNAAVNLDSEAGVRVGIVPSPTTGNGVWSDANGLTDIPLIGTSTPSPGPGFLADPYAGILMHRNASFGEGGTLEWYDLANEVLLTHARSGPWKDLEAGPFGRLYGRELNYGGFVTVDLESGSEGRTDISGLPPAALKPTLVSAIPGTDDLLIFAEGSVNGPVHVYTVDVRTGVATNFWTSLSGAQPGTPQGATVMGNKGYLLGQEGDILEVDLTTGAMVSTDLGVNGSYFDIKVSPAGNTLLLLYRTPGTVTGNVTEYDPVSGIQTPRIVADPTITFCTAMVLDGSTLWIARRAQGSLTATLSTYDATTWTLMEVYPESIEFNVEDIALPPASTRFDQQYCTQTPKNSNNRVSWITAFGSPVVADDDFELRAFNMPNNQFGIFINGPGQISIDMPGQSYNTLCVGPTQGRFDQSIFDTGISGSASLQVDLANMPTNMGPVPVLPGDTYTFQAWHRQGGGGAGFTDAIQVTFQ